MERTCHLTSLKTFHTTPTKTLTTYHALLATFHNLQINDCPRFHTIQNPSTKQHQSTKKPSTTADINTFSNFLDTSQPKLQTLGEKNRKREIIWYIWYSPHLARMYPLIWGVPSLSCLRRNSPRSMCYTRSLTETASRSVTVARQTSNRTSTATTNSGLHNKFMPSRSCYCTAKTECPLSGNCLKELVVYQATVSTEDRNPSET